MFARYRTGIIVIAAALALFAAAELALRLSGFGSFPLYDVGGEVKYIPAANQSGAFLNRNHWIFNDRHMGNAANWTPGPRPDILLIGNSIVLGGLPYDQDQKLGPLLAKALDECCAVWSVAAGGWSNVNEMAYFDRNPDILPNADVVVIEYMEGGLSALAAWPGETVFPDHAPLSVSLYTFQKYVLPKLEGLRPVNDSGALPPVGAPDPEQLARFRRFVAAAAGTSQVLIFLFPGRQVLSDQERWREITAPVADICNALAVTCLDIAGQDGWRADLYGPDGVHPNVEGNRTLARILAENVSRLRAEKKM